MSQVFVETCRVFLGFSAIFRFFFFSVVSSVCTWGTLLTIKNLVFEYLKIPGFLEAKTFVFHVFWCHCRVFLGGFSAIFRGFITF